MIHTLTEELVRRGHEVTLFASGDSRTSARLVVTCAQALWHRRPPLHDFTPAWMVGLGRLLREIDDFDVVHSHLDTLGFPLARQATVPVLTTLHGRLDLPELNEVFEEFCEVPLVSISDAQRRPVGWANFVATVHHGIELDEFCFSGRRGDYLAFLGRVSPDKGLDAAIRVARAAGLPLKVAARMPLPGSHDTSSGADSSYWDEVIRPLLGDDVELLGEVGGEDKSRFLRNAAALVFPIRWPEPFGLVMIEALACGTPVLALRQGSVPEVIGHGVTGFVVDGESDLARAVGRLDEIDRRACRDAAEEHFSPRAMADAYERVYASLVDVRSPTVVDLAPLARSGPDRQADAESLSVIAVRTSPTPPRPARAWV